MQKEEKGFDVISQSNQPEKRVLLMVAMAIGLLLNHIVRWFYRYLYRCIDGSTPWH